VERLGGREIFILWRRTSLEGGGVYLSGLVLSLSSLPGRYREGAVSQVNLGREENYVYGSGEREVGRQRGEEEVSWGGGGGR